MRKALAVTRSDLVACVFYAAITRDLSALDIGLALLRMRAEKCLLRDRS